MPPNATTVSDIPTLLGYSQTVTDGLFGVMVVISIWVVMFLSLGGFRKDAGAIPASFITFLLVSMATAMGWLDGGMLVFTVAMLIGSFLLYKLSG